METGAWRELFSATDFRVFGGSLACSRDAGRATFPGYRSIAPDMSNPFGASDGDSPYVVDAGTRARYKQLGPDDTETARTTLDSTGSGDAAYPFIPHSQDVLRLRCDEQSASHAPAPEGDRFQNLLSPSRQEIDRALLLP